MAKHNKIPLEEICYRCEKPAYRREYNKGIWTTKYICQYHYHNDHWINVEKKDPNSRYNLDKSVADSRTCNLDRFNNLGKAIIGQWITGKTLGIKDLNIENNHFREVIDHSFHHIYGNIDTKTVSYDIYNKWWSVTCKNHNFDHICVLCMDNRIPWTIVERVYMIPEKEIVGKGITIVKNPSKGGWYEKFRFEEKLFNDTYISVAIPRFFSPFDLWRDKYELQRI